MANPFWFKVKAPIQSQIGWSPASGGSSNTLTLQPAGHAPGLYLICPVTVIRTTATGTALSASLSWNSPTFGAEAKSPFASISWGNSGTVQASTGTAGQPARAYPIISDGSAAITIVWNAGSFTGGPPVADLYAMAQLLAFS